jgi:hypothetical protein
MDMQQEIAGLMAKYGALNVAKQVRKMRTTDTSKIAKLQVELDKSLREFGSISLPRFRKEAAAAWHRVFPEGLEKKPVKGYQLFLQQMMPNVKAENPGLTHVECMAVVGRLWQARKGVPADEAVPRNTEEEGHDEDPGEVASDAEMEMEAEAEEPEDTDADPEEPPCRRSKRARVIRQLS